jgi:hypothetical protein
VTLIVIEYKQEEIMKKYFLIISLLIVALFIGSSGYCVPVPVGGNVVYDYDNMEWVPMSANASGATEVSMDPDSLNPVSSFQDSLGSATKALVDADDRAMVNLASDTIGLMEALDLLRTANVVATSTAVLAAGVAQEVGGQLPAGTPRKFIEISSDTDAEFWVSIDATTAIGTVGVGRRCIGNCYLELRGGAGSINVIANSIMNLYIIEGGNQ